MKDFHRSDFVVMGIHVAVNHLFLFAPRWASRTCKVGQSSWVRPLISIRAFPCVAHIRIFPSWIEWPVLSKTAMVWAVPGSISAMLDPKRKLSSAQVACSHQLVANLERPTWWLNSPTLGKKRQMMREGCARSRRGLGKVTPTPPLLLPLCEGWGHHPM